MNNQIERVVYKSKVKKFFDVGGGVCYLKLRGSIYFLASTKYSSIDVLRKVTDVENKTPFEFYEIIHKNYLMECEKTRKTNEKKQIYYKNERLRKKKQKIKKLKEEIKQLELEVKGQDAKIPKVH